MDIPARLRWRCRRGTKELDMVLLRFLEAAYPDLDAGEREAFDRLLDAQDPDLAGWLWGGTAAPEEWTALIERIRTASGIASIGQR